MDLDRYHTDLEKPPMELKRHTQMERKSTHMKLNTVGLVISDLNKGLIDQV